MSHLRKQIRDRIAVILTGLPTIGSEVFVGRARPLAKDHDPTLLIYTTSETSERDAYPTEARRLIVHVEARVSTVAAPDDNLDAIAVEVEAAMAADRLLAGLALDLQYQQMEQVVEASGDRYLGGLRLQYVVSYRVREGVPIEAV